MTTPHGDPSALLGVRATLLLALLSESPRTTDEVLDAIAEALQDDELLAEFPSEYGSVRIAFSSLHDGGDRLVGGLLDRLVWAGLAVAVVLDGAPTLYAYPPRPPV